MKKILFITPFPPSTLGAGVNYTRQLLEELSQSFKIDLIYFRSKEDSFYTPPNTNVRVKKIFEISKLRKILSVIFLPFLFPLFTAKFSFSYLANIRSIINNGKFDIIYFDFSQMFLYAKFIQSPTKIFMSHDIIGQRYERKNKYIGKWAKFSERWILKSNNNIFTFSQKDSDLLKNWYNIKSKSTQFYFEESVRLATPKLIGPYFVFFAMWKRPDNYEGLEWFVDNVLPYLEDLQFRIIGSGLPDYLQKKISNFKNVEYLGFIDNPYPIIANSKALISPLFHGAGIKVKVLDALAVGTPIIGTDLSFEGVDDMYSSLIFKAATPSEFIELIKHIDIQLSVRIKIKDLFISQNKSKEIIKYLQAL